MYKNRLQEHTQRSSIPLPVYLTVNEGPAHAPKFKSTVIVGGVSFQSPEACLQRKEAEQSAAKMALEELSRKIEEEALPSISSDITFCKSILNEFSVKMNMEKPEYKCSQSEGILPTFISSLELSGKIYRGTIGRNKKEAHQLAAQAAIESILDSGDSQQRAAMSQIIRSKGKLYEALGQTKEIKDAPVANSQPHDLVEEEIYSASTQSPEVNALTFAENLKKKSKSKTLKAESRFLKKGKIKKKVKKSKLKKSTKAKSRKS